MFPERQSGLRTKSKDVSSPSAADQAFLTKLRPIIIAVMLLLFFLSATGFLLMLPTARSGRVDFRSFYTVGYMARTGHAGEIYEFDQYRRLQNELVGPAEATLPFNHLAYESLLYVPFSFLSYKLAYFAFFAANLIVLAASIQMFRTIFSPLAELWSYLPQALGVCFLPVTMALIEGQDSLFLLALFMASFIAMNRLKDFRAGVLVGFTLFKFQYALPIALLFLVWRRWSFFAGFASSAAFVLSLSFGLTGTSGAVSYLHSVMEVSSRFSSANGVLYGVHPEGMPNLRGLAYILSGGSTPITQVMVFLSSALVVIWGAFKRPSFPGAMLVALLVSYHQVISDTSLLLLPVGFVLSHSLAEARSNRARIAVALACCCFVGPAILLWLGTRFYLLALPVLGLFIYSNGTPMSPKHGATLSQRPQTDTKFSLPRSTGV